MFIVVFFLNVVLLLGFLYIFRPSLDAINSYFLLSKYIRLNTNYKIVLLLITNTFVLVYIIYIIYKGVESLFYG